MVHGFVPDLRPYYRQAAVVVVPLLRGGGTNLKVLEAAASGKAIVTTSVGVEGLPFRAGDDLLVADSEADFARAVVLLLKDQSRQQQLGRHARQVSLRHDWEGIEAQICRLLELILTGHQSRKNVVANEVKAEPEKGGGLAANTRLGKLCSHG